MRLYKRRIQWNRIILGLLLGLLMGALIPSTPAEAEEMEHNQEHLQERFLKTDQKVLRDKAGEGEIVTLRGTNAGGWQVMEAWMCPTNSPDQKTTIAVLTERFGDEKAQKLLQIYEQAWWQEQDFDHAKELNFNVLRLPISCYNLLQPDGSLREDTLAALDWFVKECEERELYVILDLHAAPGSQNGRDHSGDTSGSILFTDEKAQELTISLWKQLAEHFKGNATIAGYDLLNEPEGAEEERSPWGRVQLPFMDRLYQAIRAIDKDHIIILNAIWEPENMPDPSEYGWENVMYEYHFYGWDKTNDVKAQKAFTDSKVRKNNQADHPVPVLVGEFTLFEKPESWEYALRTYEANGWCWTTWTYKTVNMGSWGIYNSTNSATPKVDIYQDTEEVIAEKWSKVTTVDSFQVNQFLYKILQKWAGRTPEDIAIEKAAEEDELRRKKEEEQINMQEADRKAKALEKASRVQSAAQLALVSAVLLTFLAIIRIVMKKKRRSN
ncbi:MAG: glycoside hydrolase [Firmicutes bacterium]|nr:glycoside hydrolase [Bacillota bacterium]